MTSSGFFFFLSSSPFSFPLLSSSFSFWISHHMYARVLTVAPCISEALLILFRSVFLSIFWTGQSMLFCLQLCWPCPILNLSMEFFISVTALFSSWMHIFSFLNLCVCDFNFLNVCVMYMCMYGVYLGVHACHGAHVQVRGKLYGVGSLLSPWCGFQGWKARSRQACLASAFTFWALLLAPPFVSSLKTN